MASPNPPAPATGADEQAVGPPLGDLGVAPTEEMLLDGQEEIFARSEFEAGGPEHQAAAGQGEEPGP